MAVAQEENNTLWPEGHNGSMTHTAGNLLTVRTGKHQNTNWNLLLHSPSWQSGKQWQSWDRGTDPSMSFIPANLITLKKVNFCAAKGFGDLPFGPLKSVQ